MKANATVRDGSAVAQNLEKNYIKNSLDKFYNATEFSLSGICILNENFNFIYLNKSAADNRGYERTYISSKNFFDFLSPENRQTPKQIKNQILSGKWLGELEIIDKNNQKKILNVVINPLPPQDKKIQYLVTETDLTEPRTTENKLQETKNEYQQFFDACSDIMVKIDQTGRIEKINRKILDFGYTQADFINKKFQDLVAIFPAKSLALMAKKFIISIKAGQNEPYEIEAKTKQGENRFLEVSTIRLQNDQNSGFLSILHDITERKIFEAKIQTEKEYAQSIIETAQVIILVLDPKGRIISFNNYLEKISEHKLAEVKGKDWFKIFLPKDIRESTRNLFKNAINGIQTKGQISNILTKNKEIIEIEWYDKTLKDTKDNVIGLISIGQDVTQRNNALKSLRESEKKYRTLIEKTRDIIYATDSHGFITYISPQVARYGFDPKQIQGKNFLQFVIPEDRLKLIRDYAKALKTKKQFPSHFRMKSKTGEIFWVEEESNIIFDNSKKFLGLTGILRDVTERMKSDEKLIKAKLDLENLNKSLDLKVQQNTLELRKAYDDLKSLDTLKDEFLNISAHELKTPLTSIIGLSELMMMKKQGEINPPQKQSLKIINDEANRLLNIIKKILGITRIEANKAIFDIQKINLCDLLPNVVETLKQLAERQKVTIVCARPNKEAYVNADSERTKEVVYNLIDNALKFSPPKSKIFVSGKIKGTNFIFSVKDQGPGIDPAKKEKLFQKFSQLDTGYARKQEGTGLGLYISKIIVENMGGKIWLESKQGHGAEFFFSLPLAK